MNLYYLIKSKTFKKIKIHKIKTFKMNIIHYLINFKKVIKNFKIILYISKILIDKINNTFN